MYSRTTASSRPNVDTSCPEVLPDKVALAFPIHPCQMNRALALDEANHLRHRVLRRDRNHHVHMVRHQMPFDNRALLLRGKLAEYLSEVLAQLYVQCPAPTLRDEYHLLFAVPHRVAQTSKLVREPAPIFLDTNLGLNRV